MEGGLEQAPLPAVVAVRAVPQAIADRLPGSVEDRPPFVEGLIVEQDLVDQSRVAHHGGLERAEADAHEVAVLW
jgi:hypothetical protein